MSERLWLAAAVPDDAAELGRLEEASIAGGWNERAFLRALQQHTTQLLVLRRLPPVGPPPEIAAYSLTTLAADEAQVLSLGVAAPLRGQGFARWLLRRTLKLAFDRGARSAHLEVRPSNEAALRLYRSAGFEEVLRRPGYYREPAEDALVMACTDLPRAMRLESN